VSAIKRHQHQAGKLLHDTLTTNSTSIPTPHPSASPSNSTAHIIPANSLILNNMFALSVDLPSTQPARENVSEGITSPISSLTPSHLPSFSPWSAPMQLPKIHEEHIYFDSLKIPESSPYD
jgi:hypothetical protein